MPKYGFLVVEGPHDAELAYRLLSPFRLKRIKQEADLDPFLVPLIPRKYPPDGDLQKRMPTPLFVSNDTHALAIHRAEGDSRLVKTVEENFAVLDRTQLTGFGLILDADTDKDANTTAKSRYAKVADGLNALGYKLPDSPGNVTVGNPRMGAYVLPDNSTPGTLEDLLLECAASAYPNLLASAIKHVETAFADTTLDSNDMKDLKKPSGRNKAIVGSMASILRPGKAIQVSIQDNNWLRGNCLTLLRIKAIQDFLRALLDL